MTILTASGKFAAYTNEGAFRFKSASGIEQQTDSIRIGSLKIDNHTFENVKVGRAKFKGAEPMLGIDVLARQPFALRFKNKSGLALNAPRPETPFTTLEVSSHGVVSIPIGMAGKTVRALWDTGAGLTAVDEKFVKAHPDVFKPTKQYASGVDGAGQPMLLQSFRARRLTVGEHTFEDLRVVAVDLSMLRASIHPEINAVLGFNVIRKGDWFFDTKLRLWKFER
jgi:hypothetical protein